MKLIRFLQNFFSVDGSGNPSVKYAQGQTYPESEETLSQVAAGAAEVVEVSDEVPQPQSAPPLTEPTSTEPSTEV